MGLLYLDIVLPGNKRQFPNACWKPLLGISSFALSQRAHDIWLEVEDWKMIQQTL